MRRKTLFFSFVAALILWLLILGRRDFVYTKIVDLDLNAGTGRSVVMQSADRLRVRVSGPRAAIRAFMENAQMQVLRLDLSQMDSGVQEVDVPANKIELPIGIRLLSVRPNTIKVEIMGDRAVPQKPLEPQPDNGDNPDR